MAEMSLYALDALYLLQLLHDRVLTLSNLLEPFKQPIREHGSLNGANFRKTLSLKK